MEKYITEQRRQLIAFLSAHPDEQFCVRELAEGLGSENISRSAVYRNLGTLVEEGLVGRVVRDGSRELYYQYTGCKECSGQLHLACMKCGQVIHMDGVSAQDMQAAVLNRDGFSIDSGKTVLYGVCRKCRKE